MDNSRPETAEKTTEKRAVDSQSKKSESTKIKDKDVTSGHLGCYQK